MFLMRVGVNWVHSKPNSQFVAVAAASPLVRMAEEGPSLQEHSFQWAFPGPIVKQK